MTVHRDLAYAEPKNERQSLDVYSPAKDAHEPVIIWIHGGGWQRGDKSALAVGAPEQHLLKPQAFVDHGCVFVAINYRFIPNVDLKTMAGDVAKAIGWVKRNIRQYGGDPDSLVVMGHSAGAQLAAYVCTDEEFLKAEVSPCVISRDARRRTGILTTRPCRSRPPNQSWRPVTG